MIPSEDEMTRIIDLLGRIERHARETDRSVTTIEFVALMFAIFLVVYLAGTLFFTLFNWVRLKFVERKLRDELGKFITNVKERE